MDTVPTFKDIALTKKTKKRIYDNSLDTFLRAIRQHTRPSVYRRRKYDQIYYLQGGILQTFLKIDVSTGDIYRLGKGKEEDSIASIFMTPSEIFEKISIYVSL